MGNGRPRGRNSTRENKINGLIENLTDKEYSALKLLAEGFSTEAMADSLDVTASTVGATITRIWDLVEDPDPRFTARTRLVSLYWQTVRH